MVIAGLLFVSSGVKADQISVSRLHRGFGGLRRFGTNQGCGDVVLTAKRCEFLGAEVFQTFFLSDTLFFFFGGGGIFFFGGG